MTLISLKYHNFLTLSQLELLFLLILQYNPQVLFCFFLLTEKTDLLQNRFDPV